MIGGDNDFLDIHVLELFLPLVVGASIELVSRETARDAFALQQLIERARPTMLQATLSTWTML